MKISKETLAIIKNFAAINSNLLIKAGTTLSTINAAKNVLADATVAEEFPIDFGIYDTNEFLGVLSSFTDPEVEFNDKFARISDATSSVKYYAADPAVLTVPAKKIKFPGADIEFDITASQLASVIRMASVLRAVDISINGDGKKLSISVGDLKNVTANSYEIALGTECDVEFNAVIRVENLKLMGLDYHVSISNKKISKFESSDGVVTSYIALESTSTF